jgi:hypothetical protein
MNEYSLQRFLARLLSHILGVVLPLNRLRPRHLHRALDSCVLVPAIVVLLELQDDGQCFGVIARSEDKQTIFQETVQGIFIVTLISDMAIQSERS